MDEQLGRLAITYAPEDYEQVLAAFTGKYRPLRDKLIRSEVGLLPYSPELE